MIRVQDDTKCVSRRKWNMNVLKIDAKKETEKIIKFIKKTLHEHGFQKVVIAASGGVDSTTALYLLRKALEPKNIIVVNLPYFSVSSDVPKIAAKLAIPKVNVNTISIKKMVDTFIGQFKTRDQIRVGNIMARVRMIVLYDIAKKYNALVCGTENKSEYYLAYFTRFGDEASDFELIRHLYKTQVYELAKYLGVSKEVIEQKPTAGLWQGQTDEDEFGFSYKEADQVLYYYFERKLSLPAIEKKGFMNTRKIINWAKQNSYKHHVPYTIEDKI